ncbi:MAG: hypothetical protein AB1630_07975 [bacterium]
MPIKKFFLKIFNLLIGVLTEVVFCLFLILALGIPAMLIWLINDKF